MLALDYSIVNVALPSIGDSPGFARDGVEVVSAYALMFGGFLFLGGRTLPCTAAASAERCRL